MPNSSNVSNFKLYNSEITGHNKHLTPTAIYLRRCEQITVQGCNIHTLDGGFCFVESNHINIYYNYIHDTCSSFIVMGESLNHDIVIEGNHGFGINWSLSDDYCPRTDTSRYHGSYIAIRNSDVTIRKNVFHDGGNSSGIMFYEGGVSSFNNILIENNLIYDTHNTSVLRLNMVGQNVVIRNNTVVGRGRYNGEGNYKYNIALSLNSLADNYDGSFELRNNVFVGMVAFNRYLDNIIEGNNVYWVATYNRSDVVSFCTEDDLTDSLIADSADYFENDFFSGELDVSFKGWEIDPNPDANPYNRAGHGRILDLSLHADSDAVNSGDHADQPATALGSLSGSGFISVPGQIRDSNHHSSGCYEYYSK